MGTLVSTAVALPAAGAQSSTTVPPTPEPTTVPAPGRWTALDTGTTANLTAVSFSDPLVGHVVGVGGTILATTDGGKTWTPQAACTSRKRCQQSSSDRISSDLTGVGFWDAERGVAVGTGGTIVSTDDGGKTWTPRPACDRTRPCADDSRDRTTADLTAVSVVRPSHAYAVGRTGTMLASDDHGRSWRRLPTCGLNTATGGACDGVAASGKPDLMAVTSSSPRHVYAVGADGTLLVSRNGGKTVNPLPICVGDRALLEQIFGKLRDQAGDPAGTGAPTPSPPSPEADVAVCGGQGFARRIRPDLTGIAFTDPRRRGEEPRIYATGGAGTIFAQAGASATPQFACPTSQPCVEASPDRVRAELRGIVFPNDLFGYAVGAEGAILSLKRTPTPEGDQSGAPPPAAPPSAWKPEPSGTTNDLNATSFPAPGVGYAVGNGGTVVKLEATAPGVRVGDVGPASGPTVGHKEVKISGQGFTGATDVFFGPTRVDRFTVDSDRAITATAPPGERGGVLVSVSTPRGPSSVASGGRFTYVSPEGGRWDTAPACGAPCAGPAVALRGGELLVAGGVFRGVLQGRAAANLYEPATRTWTTVGPLADPRANHTITALTDGGALVAGGIPAVVRPGASQADYSALPGAEVYDPAARTWRPAGDLAQPRALHTATLLANGKVLVAGGLVGTFEGAGFSAEIWDPASGAWSPTADMELGRYDHTATLLPGGKVLVVGGTTNRGRIASAEIYDPVSQRWQPVASPKGAHVGHTATLMANGDVFVAGGVAEGGNAVPFVERYNPKTDRWTLVAPMAVPRALHAATALPDGRLLITGGVTDDPTTDEDLRTGGVASAEIFDPATGRWKLVADMPEPRVSHAGLLLMTGCGDDCGKVLVPGGEEPLDVPLFYIAEAGAKAGTQSGMSGGRPWLVAAALAAAVAVVALAAKARRR